jgi:hypothetical protein
VAIPGIRRSLHATGTIMHTCITPSTGTTVPVPVCSIRYLRIASFLKKVLCGSTLFGSKNDCSLHSPCSSRFIVSNFTSAKFQPG